MIMNDNLGGYRAVTNGVSLDVDEFEAASRHYPIVFIPGNGAPKPVAVLGLREDSNLFLLPNGEWREGYYVPSYFRHDPYEPLPKPQDPLDHMASVYEAEAMLMERASDAVKTARKLMERFRGHHQRQTKTAAFCAALQEAGLLVESEARFELTDDTEYKLGGFLLVEEAGIAALPSDTIQQWNEQGWLDLLRLHLSSQGNWRLLVDLDRDTSPRQ